MGCTPDARSNAPQTPLRTAPWRHRRRERDRDLAASPRSQLIVHWPRSAFSTMSNPLGDRAGADLGAQALNLAPPAILRSIEEQIAGGNPVGQRVVPLHDQSSRRRRAPRRAPATACMRAARARRSCQQIERRRRRPAPAGVGDDCPSAMMPTPYSGSQRICDPNPGRPPLCATMCAKPQSANAKPVAVAAAIQLTAPLATCRATRVARRPPRSAASRAATRDEPGRSPGHRAAATRRGMPRRSGRGRERDVSMPPIAPNAPSRQLRLFLPLLVLPAIALREPLRRHRGGSSVVDVMPSGFRIVAVDVFARTACPTRCDTMRPRIAKP